MTLSSKTKELLERIKPASTKLGDIRALAKPIKKDHALALELWSTGAYLPRQLAILIMDRKQLSQAVIDQLDQDMQHHDAEEQLQLMDWLMANQLTKDKRTVALMGSWEHSPSALQRRIFWYFQGRLRWMGQPPPPNTEQLLSAIAARMESEVEAVQWAMNFTVAQIGIHEAAYRSRCIALGERIGLYRHEVVHRGCTPQFLPAYIAVEVAKRQG